MIRSRLEQTNSLVNSGDFITIKIPYPINRGVYQPHT